MEKLTSQEEKIMLLIWQKGEGTIREYFELNNDAKMPYTTFASNIKSLEKKGFIDMHRTGKTFICKPVVEEEIYKSACMSGFIRDYFQNSYKAVVSLFAKEEKISASDLEEIIKVIERDKQ